ncbi:MAG TPA: DUF952 domain-containing protein [Rhizomicrobium sp.]|jgi:uncharacterized protein (DUF952 family)|nr:DUF952 domain-containing protein [Rhizomicrobium sp.]
MATIFKVVPAAEWAEAERAGAYAGSAHDQADGFLHFSTAPQLAETLRRYYPGRDGLVLVAVDPAPLGAALRWEHAPSRGEDFPHLFAALPITAVRWVRPIARDAGGTAVLPDMD